MWRYFGRMGARGKVVEVFRCPANGKPIIEQKIEDVELLLKDGAWRSNMRNVLVDEELKGRFDEKDDEISEDKAMEYYRCWQNESWPGRN